MCLLFSSSFVCKHARKRAGRIHTCRASLCASNDRTNAMYVASNPTHACMHTCIIMTVSHGSLFAVHSHLAEMRAYVYFFRERQARKPFTAVASSLRGTTPSTQTREHIRHPSADTTAPPHIGHCYTKHFSCVLQRAFRCCWLCIVPHIRERACSPCACVSIWHARAPAYRAARRAYSTLSVVITAKHGGQTPTPPPCTILLCLCGGSFVRACHTLAAAAAAVSSEHTIHRQLLNFVVAVSPHTFLHKYRTRARDQMPRRLNIL